MQHWSIFLSMNLGGGKTFFLKKRLLSCFFSFPFPFCELEQRHTSSSSGTQHKYKKGNFWVEELEQEIVAGRSAPDRAISLLSAALFTTPVEISTPSVMLNAELTVSVDTL